MFEILPQSEGANIAVKASGIISESDYEAIMPEFERLIEKLLRFRVLLDWESLEMWEDGVEATTFGLRFIHRLRCERLAIISDDPRRLSDIEDLRAILPRSTELQVFPPSQRDQAWSWLTGD